MCLVVNLGEMLPVQMRINLRGADARVAEHFLHCSQVAGGLQHVAGEGVAQHMRMHMLVEAHASRPAVEAKLYAALPQAPAGLANK